MARRYGLGSAAAAFCALLVATDLPAFATDAGTKQHALSLVGAPKFGPDFQHFDWVNPNAPKGGRVRQWALGSFDSPQSRSRSRVTGSRRHPHLRPADVLEPGRSSYGLRPDRRMGDASRTISPRRPSSCARRRASTTASPITAEDVIFSLDAIKKASPNYAFYYKNVTKAEKTGDRPGHLPLRRQRQPRAADDRRRAADPAQAFLGRHRRQRRAARPRQVHARGAAGLGSLPHQGGRCRPHASPTSASRTGGPRICRSPRGNGTSTRSSSSTSAIACRPSRPSSPASSTSGARTAPRLGRRRSTSTPSSAGWSRWKRCRSRSVAPMQAFAFNIRRPQFQDPRVRQAFNLAFDFEWANKNLFYDQYIARRQLLRQLGAEGDRPAAGARARDPERGQGPGAARGLHHRMEEPGQRHAARMRASTCARRPSCSPRPAGQPKDGVLTNAKGVQLTAEFLLVQPDFERIVLPYKTALEKLGIKANVRIVDTSQYQRRHDTFDFDIIVATFPPVAVARQRAARLLGLGGGRQGRQPQRHRHQEPGHRQADRQDHPRQGPRRAGGRHARARSRAAVEPLRRAAVAHALRPAGDVGHVRPPGQAALAQHARSCGCGGTTKRRPSGSPMRAANAASRELEARDYATLVPGDCAVCAVAGVLHGCLSASARRRTAAGMACRPSASSSIRPTSSISTGSIPTRPKGGRLATIGTGAPHHLRQLQRLHPEGRRGAGARVCCSTA